VGVKLYQLGIIALLLVPLCASKNSYADSNLKWQPIGSDLELGRVTIESGALFNAELLLVRSSLKHYRLGVLQASNLGLRKATVRAMTRSSRAVAAINANFFDEDGKPLGLIITHGVLQQRMHQRGNTLTGVFAVSRNSISITQRDRFEPAAVLEAIQAGPRLIANGVALGDLKQPKAFARRSGVCVDRTGRMVLFCVGEGLIGTSFEDLTKTLLSPGIECKDALNFDGGGSAQIYIDGSRNGLAIEELSVDGRDEVPVALALFGSD